MMNRHCAQCVATMTYYLSCGRDDVVDWARGLIGQGDYVREEASDRLAVVLGFSSSMVEGRRQECMHLDYGVFDEVHVNFNWIDCIYTDIDGVKVYRLK